MPLVEALPWKSNPDVAPDELLPVDAVPELPVEAVELAGVDGAGVLAAVAPLDVLLVEGVLLATVVGVVLLVVALVVAGVEPEVVERAAVLAVPLELVELVELVEPLVMRVLALVDAVLAVVLVLPVDDELEDPSSTHADTNSDAIRTADDFEKCAARGRVVATLGPSSNFFAHALRYCSSSTARSAGLFPSLITSTAAAGPALPCIACGDAIAGDWTEKRGGGARGARAKPLMYPPNLRRRGPSIGIDVPPVDPGVTTYAASSVWSGPGA